MEWINLMDKIASIGFIFCSLGSIYCEIVMHKNKKIYLKDLNDYADKHPDEIVSRDIEEEFQNKYDQMFNRPLKIKIIFTILCIIFGTISIWF